MNQQHQAVVDLAGMTVKDVFSKNGAFVYKVSPPAAEFLYEFPSWLESGLSWFDDPLIDLCQKPKGKFFIYFSKIVTFLVTIEFLLALPIVLFIIGFDVLAVKILYLAMVIVVLSQIPKRFLWRYRPFMAYRAIEYQRPKTSSFPSRAVACSVVYCYLIVYTVLYFRKDIPSVDWWMYLLFLVVPIVVSFARIHLGSHYPSDCVAGAVLGAIVCVIAKILCLADLKGCSCPNGNENSQVCYSSSQPDAVHRILPETIVATINWYLVLGALGGQLLFSILMVIKPIKFWMKFGAVFGLLFPALTFRLVFICPTGAFPSALEAPSVLTESPKWWTVLYAVGVCLLGMGVGIKLQKKLLLLVFVGYWLFYVSAISLWRLFKVGEMPFPIHGNGTGS